MINCHGCGAELTKYKKKWCSGKCQYNYKPKENKPKKEMRRRMLTHYTNMYCIGKMDWKTVRKNILEL